MAVTPRWGDMKKTEAQRRAVDKCKRHLEEQPAIRSLKLTDLRLIQLSKRLLSLRDHFDIVAFGLPSGTATDARLAKIQMSLGRLIKELGGPDKLSSRVRLRISEGLEFSLNDWIFELSLVLDATKSARRGKKVPLAREQPEVWEFADPKRILCGKTLPELYKEFSGRDFGVSKTGEGGRAKDTSGVAFVIACHRAMGLGAITPETVKSHWLAVKRAGSK